MANYTSDEVQAAVSKIIRSTVRHPTGSLGERQVSTSFNDLQEAASGVYILYFNAPYYTLLLGVRRLTDSLSSQASTIASLIDAIQAVKRTVTPVTDLTNLAQAKAALEELQAAVSSRTSGFTNIQAVPAFRRYAANLDAFLTTHGSNVLAPTNPASSPTTTTQVTQNPATPTVGLDSSTISSTNPQGLPTTFTIADTPAGAVAQIPGLVSQLKEQQDELVRRVSLLSTALADFTSLNLPQIAAQGVISRAHDVLAGHLTDLSALDENARLANLRGVVLDLLTQKPLVEAYGAGLNPSEFITTQGLAKAYSDSLHLATPASVLSSIPGPYALTDTSHFIKVTVDGGTPFEYPLPIGYLAELNGTLTEPFKLDLTSNALHVTFGDPNGTPAVFDVALTTGTRTAAEILADVSPHLTGTDLVLEKVFSPVRYNSPMVVTSLGGNLARFNVLAGGLTGLGIKVGDQVDILGGPNLGMTLDITGVDAGGLFLLATGPSPVTSVATPGVAVQVGPAARALRFRDTNASVSLAQRRAIALPVVGGPSDVASALLGFAPGISVRSTPVAASDIATNITSSTSLFGAAAVDLANYAGSGHANLTDATLVTISEYLATGAMTAGTAVTFTVASGAGEVNVGSRLVIRSTTTTADVNQEGAITAYDPVAGIVSVTFATPVTGGSVEVEAGPALSFGYGAVLTITDGPNQGRYTTREAQAVGTTCSFEMLLDRALPVPKSGSTALTFALSFGASYVSFSSPSPTIGSHIEVDNGTAGTAAAGFFGASSLPATGDGESVYLQFDTYPKGAAVGDLVQLFENQYNLVSREFSIVGTEPGLRVLKLSSSVESDFNMTFDMGVPNPFGAIRIAQTANYGDFKALLDAWLARPELTTQYYRDLARFLNPVLTNSNPTSAAVDDAVAQLQKLSAITSIAGANAYASGQLISLEYALDQYESPVEPSVDALISTFRNKGADRAIDLLLEGQFSTFFGLDLNTVSYSGAFSQSARDVAMNDLPIRKTNRSNALGQQVIGTIPNQVDYEHDSSDADAPGVLDIPGNPDVSGPADSY